MAYQLASAFVDVQVRSGGLIGAFGSIKAQVNALLSGFGNVSPLLGAVAGVGSLTYAIYQFMGAAEHAYAAEVRLESVIRASGNAAGIAKEEVLALSAALQQKGTFGNTEITAASTALLQMRAVSRQTLPEVLKLSQDVAAAGFGNLETASRTLGRALADPARGIYRLRSIGIMFTQSEREMIASLAKTNNVLAAQRIILDKVRDSVGGTNEALAKTPAGQWMQIKNNLGDIAETLGKKIYPIAVDIGRTILRITRPIAWLVGAALDLNMALGNWPIKLAMAGVAAYGIVVAFRSIHATSLLVYADILKIVAGMQTWLFGYLQPVSMGFVAMPGMIAKIATAWNTFIAQVVAGEVLTGWMIPLVIIGAVISAIAAEVYLLHKYLSTFPEYTEAWATFFDAVSLSAGVVWNAIKEVGMAMLEVANAILPDWIRQLPIIKDFLEGKIVPAIAGIINLMADGLLLFSAIFKMIARQVKDIANDMRDAVTSNYMAIFNRKRVNPIEDFMDQLSKSKEALKLMKEMRANPPKAAGMGEKGTVDILDTGKGGLSGLQDAWKNVQEALSKRENPAERTADAVEGIEETSGRTLEEIIKIGSKLGVEGAVA